MRLPLDTDRQKCRGLKHPESTVMCLPARFPHAEMFRDLQEFAGTVAALGDEASLAVAQENGRLP